MSCIIIFEACLSNHSQLSRMKRLEKLQDLVKEAKRRTFLWVILVSGLAYLFSRTSSSIWLNLPIAAFILVVIRYLSFELEIRRRVQLSEVPSHIAHLMKYQLSLDDSFSCPPSALTSWKRKIDSAVVEAAIDSFTRRIVQEFVTDLWYSALSPDQDVPQQLCLMINDIFAELAQRVKRINLITLLTRDIVDVVGNHLELFRQTKGAIMLFEYLSSEEREEKLKSSLLKRNQLHPALISSESECKVLERLMGGVVAILLRPQDAQCLLVRGIARELLACAVLRPVMNFASPGFSNFEQLHRNLRDLPHYNLQLPPKRFWLSGLDDSFVRDRCILLDKYLKDLLLIPSIAELHEVWDFLSVTSKNYAYSKSPSVMKTLAVNVDDAVDDMFRQFKGVSDGLLGRAGGPPSHAMDAACQGGEPKLPGQVEAAIGHLDRERTEQLSDDEYGGPPSVLDGETAYLMEGWSYDKDLPMQDPLPNILPQRRLTEYDKNDQWPEKRIERGSSEAFSLEESTAGSEIFEEEHVVPPEWTPPKLTVPILNLVDSIFQLQERGWIRRQVFWMAKQILQLGMGDAVDEWLVTQIQRLRREDVVASTISMLQETLWPGGVFITKKKNAESSTDGALAKINKQASQKGMDQSAFFESQLESFRCASVVHDALVDGAPAALTSLVGKTQYTRCAKDLYYFLQSSAFLKQLVYSMLETLLIATFPELAHLIIDIRREGSGQVVM